MYEIMCVSQNCVLLLSHMNKLCSNTLKQHCLPYHLILQPSLPQSICPSLLSPAILVFMQSAWLPCRYSAVPYFHLLTLRRNLKGTHMLRPQTQLISQLHKLCTRHAELRDLSVWLSHRGTDVCVSENMLVFSVILLLFMY